MRQVLTLLGVLTLAAPAGAASSSGGQRMALGRHLVAFEQRACDRQAAALDAPGTSGGADAYRAAVAWRAARDVARVLGRATGHAPRLVTRDDRGRCTGPVPAATTRRVRVDGRALVRRWQRAYCLARANQNYEVDKAATAETLRVVRRLTADLPRSARPRMPR